MAERPISRKAQRAIDQFVVKEGLSYEDAIRRCEAWAEKEAAPYLEAAALLRAQLADDAAS